MQTPETLILLAGEQAAPNLIPARYFQPRKVFILHSKFPRSASMAENLEMLLKDMDPHLETVDDYDVGKIRERVEAVIGGLSSVVVNVTGGTKPMSLGALEAARGRGAQAVYVRSQGSKTEVDLYDLGRDGSTNIRETISLDGTISLNDYLVSYFGKRWSASGFGGDKDGLAFERAIHEVLTEGVDEVVSGWRDSSNQVEIDFVVRCNNQIGLIEAKTGKGGSSMKDVKQLALSGGQRFFGTYVKRMLVVDKPWGKSDANLRGICDMLDIALVELPGFSGGKTLTPADRDVLLQAIHAKMGKPLKGMDR